MKNLKRIALCCVMTLAVSMAAACGTNNNRAEDKTNATETETNRDENVNNATTGTETTGMNGTNGNGAVDDVVDGTTEAGRDVVDGAADV